MKNLIRATLPIDSGFDHVLGIRGLPGIVGDILEIATTL